MRGFESILHSKAPPFCTITSVFSDPVQNILAFRRARTMPFKRETHRYSMLNTNRTTRFNFSPILDAYSLRTMFVTCLSLVLLLSGSFIIGRSTAPNRSLLTIPRTSKAMRGASWARLLTDGAYSGNRVQSLPLQQQVWLISFQRQRHCMGRDFPHSGGVF